MLLSILASTFLEEGSKIMGWRVTLSIPSNTATINWLFWAPLGCNPLICMHLWNWLGMVVPDGIVSFLRSKHLLWALLFLKQYQPTEITSALAAVDKKTFRYWSWKVIQYLAEIDVVSSLKVLYILLTFK